MAEEHNSEHVITLFRFRMRDLTPAQREEYNSTTERSHRETVSESALTE